MERCLVDGACSGGNWSACGPGFTGPMCGRCVHGAGNGFFFPSHYRVGSSGVCELCDSQHIRSSMVVAAVLAGMLALIVVGVLALQRRHKAHHDKQVEALKSRMAQSEEEHKQLQGKHHHGDRIVHESRGAGVVMINPEDDGKVLIKFDETGEVHCYDETSLGSGRIRREAVNKMGSKAAELARLKASDDDDDPHSASSTSDPTVPLFSTHPGSGLGMVFLRAAIPRTALCPRHVP